MDSLQGIQEQLATIAKQREQERVAAHEDAMATMAGLRKQEEEKQAAAKDMQRLAKERRSQLEKTAHESEQTRVREQENEKRLVEQEENRKQEALDNLNKTRAALEKRMLDMEHAEELAKKALLDSITVLSTSSERIVPNPLQRFLQQTPE